MVDHECGWIQETNEAVNDHSERHSIVVDSLLERDFLPVHVDQYLGQ